MQYYSTRNHAALFSLQEAAFRGLAPDGGLFMPAVIPHADLEKVCELSECSFSELSRYLTRLFFGGELPETRTDAIAAGACRFPVPLTRGRGDMSNPSRHTQDSSSVRWKSLR